MNEESKSPVSSVLIVDDTPANIGVLRNMLQDEGYQIYAATSGAAALKIAFTSQPDLILLDVTMPDMDGLETCRHLKNGLETRDIPIIFVTARTDTEDILAGFKAGGVDYIDKPVRREEVCARVRTHLSLRRHSTALAEQAERFRAIVTNMWEGLLIVDGESRIQFANPAAASLLCSSCDALINRSITELLANPGDLVLGQDGAANEDKRAARNAIPHGPREINIKRDDGSCVPMDMVVTPLFGPQLTHIVLLHDISRHKQAEGELLRVTRLDPLTEMANRRHFDEVIKREWQRAQRNGLPLSLLMVDVDHFKLYNDTYGHQAGDLCLQQIAQVLKAHAQRPSDLAARFGGEEFILLFAETSASSAMLLAEKIRSAIESLHIEHSRNSASQWVTASIGAATMQSSVGMDISQLFAAADAALYRAKERGRNRVEA